MDGRGGDVCGGPQGDVDGTQPIPVDLSTYQPPPDPHKSTRGSCPCSCSSSSKHKNKDVEFGELGIQVTGNGHVTTEGSRSRKWKYFQGNNHFYCDGRIMTAPSIRYFSLSFALILLTFGLFIVFEYVSNLIISLNPILKIVIMYLRIY